ncbi:hypothetical protein JD844_012946 [Phrynosoma platyrhinos]|uniref:Interleukin-1 receptor-associated kinase-like 2 n=1 Tax=Phrynosoma platyrhinos TaxID=52577 RepID=A0ABQ7TKK9_PHRPL|nr:hypothetical protein JD844_012946 [Phrynosoma platyrhinos]
MAQQQQWGPLPSLSPAAPSSSPPPEYIHSLPAWVLEDFCQKMDCLSEYDWMRFASYVITDQTELRKIKCMEKAGISITRELMWWWGVRLATVQQLLDLLQELQLYHAAQVITDGMSLSFAHDSVRPSQQGNRLLHPAENKQIGLLNEPEVLPSLHSDPALKADGDIPPLSPPPTSVDLPHSLHSNVKLCSASVPQQESIPNLAKSDSLLWTSGEVETATSGFSEENRISEGIFAVTYKGNKYILFSLYQNQTQRFFHTEVQIYFRCCHPNIIQLLGFCVESVFHCLIYPYMPNGSLMDRLQCQGGSESLSWEKRIKISLGLIQAIQHLHQLGVIHGNVKSSNVLLDANYVPQLGHSGLRLHPMEKKSDHAMMKTKVLQVSLAYFPEDFVRHGQLTEKVDIFACGIVLAEILTGMKAMDEERNPIFLKDALLEEIQVAKELSSSKERTFERLAAMEICRKYQDKQAICLPETTTVCLALATCVCLRKKKADLAKDRHRTKKRFATVREAEDKAKRMHKSKLPVPGPPTTQPILPPLASLLSTLSTATYSVLVDKESHHLDIFGRHFYSSAVLSAKVGNAQACMGAYQKFVWDRMAAFIPSLPEQQRAAALDFYSEAFSVMNQQINSARHSVDCVAKVISAAVALHRCAWLKSTDLFDEVKKRVEDLSFEGLAFPAHLNSMVHRNHPPLFQGHPTDLNDTKDNININSPQRNPLHLSPSSDTSTRTILSHQPIPSLSDHHHAPKPSHFYNTWKQISTDTWVLTIIHLGYAIEQG